MRSLKTTIIILFLINSTDVLSQNTYSLSAGISIPDNISNKYLRPGINLGYEIDLKIYKNLFINTGLSISFNNKNKTYTFGFDDDPFYQNLPEYLQEIFAHPSSYYDKLRVYLFNPSLDLNLKYLFNIKGRFSLFLISGIKGSYSFYEDMYEVVVEDVPDEYIGFTSYGTGEPLTLKFNIAYNFGSGLNYRFKNGKSIFLEADYQMIPNIKLGRNNDRIGLFIIRSGISFPFKKTKKKGDAKN